MKPNPAPTAIAPPNPTLYYPHLKIAIELCTSTQCYLVFFSIIFYISLLFFHGILIMSRLYFTAEMKYKDGIKLPVFRIWTGDHTGGTYHIGGLYPSTIATMTGKGPQYADQERFDLKFNVNKTRANASLICNTTKHLPAVSWSTDTGMSANYIQEHSASSLIISRQTPLGNRNIGCCPPRQESECQTYSLRKVKAVFARACFS